MEAVRSESLTPGRSYALSNALERGRKAFLQVKLTDSFITSLEQFQAAEVCGFETSARLRGFVPFSFLSLVSLETNGCE